MFCVTDFVSAIKQNVSIDLWKFFLVPPPNKILGMDLVPFSEMVVNHCCKSKKRPNYHSIFLSGQNNQAGCLVV